MFKNLHPKHPSAASRNKKFLTFDTSYGEPIAKAINKCFSAFFTLK